MVADMELKFIRDRQRAGIETAKGKAPTQDSGTVRMRRKSSGVHRWGFRRPKWPVTSGSPA